MRNLILIFFLFLFSCNENKFNENLIISIKQKNWNFYYETKKTPIYILKNQNLIFWLDSIIYYEKNCPYFDSINSGFMIEIYNKNEETIIEVCTEIKFAEYHKLNYGSLKYKNLNFLIFEKIKTNIFLESKDSVLVRNTYLKNKIKVHTFQDELSNWKFKYVNGNIVFVSNYICPK